MPSRHLTARNVAAMKPWPGKLRTVRDELTGLELRIRPDGDKTWTLRYRISGQQRRWKIGSLRTVSLANARKAANRILLQVSNGTDPQTEKRNAKLKVEVESRRLKFDALADRYMNEHARTKKRTWRIDRRILASYVRPKWKQIPAEDITRADVRQLVEAIATRGAPIQANRVLEVVQSLFNFALDHEIVDVNPAARVKDPGVEKSRDRVLSDDEIRKFWTALDKQPEPAAAFAVAAETESAARAAMTAAFRLRLLTAQRGGEVHRMRWQDVDLDGGWWTIPADHSKNGLPHRVPLVPTATTIIKSLARGEGRAAAYVLASMRGPAGVRRRSRMVKAMVLVDFTPHDLRRTAASRMASAGVSRFVIARVLNHADRGITSVYDRHSYDTEKRLAMETWDKALDAVLKAKSK